MTLGAAGRDRGKTIFLRRPDAPLLPLSGAGRCVSGTIRKSVFLSALPESFYLGGKKEREKKKKRKSTEKKT